MVFLGDAMHLSVSSAPINRNGSNSHPMSGYSNARLHLHIHNDSNAVWYVPYVAMCISVRLSGMQ
jgi:hypothetical protein